MCPANLPAAATAAVRTGPAGLGRLPLAQDTLRRRLLRLIAVAARLAPCAQRDLTDPHTHHQIGGTAPAHASTLHVDALVLSCMDFRMVEPIHAYLRERGLYRDYDHVILAGASAGVVTGHFASWAQTFWDHVETAIAVHQIRRVIVIDHRGCAAYNVMLGRCIDADPAHERAVHIDHLHRLRDQIRERYPRLEVELLLMALDGSVEVIG